MRQVLRLLFAALCVCVAGVACAQTAQTKATLETTNNAVIVPNSVGAITAQALNSLLGNMIYSGGTLLDPNTFIPQQTFTVAPVFSSLTGCLAGNGSGVVTATGSACGSGGGIVVPVTTVTGSCTNGYFLFDNAGVVDCVASSSSIAFPQAVTGGTSGGIPYFSSTSVLSASGALTANRLVLGGGAGSAPTVAGSLGTTTTLLHGNAAGGPTFSAVSLTADVTGQLPNANLANPSTTVFGTTCTLGSTCSPSVDLTANVIGQLPNANIANVSISINGTGCTLGGSCAPTAVASSLVVGTTAISGGTSGRIAFNNSGVLGEKAVTGSGSVVLATSATLITPTLGVAVATTVNGVTIPVATDTVALLGTADQTQVGGANITPFSLGTVSSGTFTPDCGKNPGQYLTNGGAFTFAVPSSDGQCTIVITNNGSAGSISFGGTYHQSTGVGSGDSLDTTNGHIFIIAIRRVNGISNYLVTAGQ